MIYDLLIIGAGPAGITAGIYAKRANLNVAVIENNAPGGQMVSTGEIENYTGFTKIGGAELSLEMFNHGMSLGLEYIFDDVVKINDGKVKEVVTKTTTLKTRSIIIATGANPRRLGLENEDKLASRGISWCAICDGPFYKDKTVLVVGGGNSAVEEAIYLSSLATHVTVVQNLEKFTADKKTIDILLKKDNVKIYYNSLVKEFLIDEDNNLKAVRININNEKELDIEVDGVFEYIGLKPTTAIFKDLGILNNYGYIETDLNMATSLKGIYAAGDVRDKNIRQISTAVNDGAIAVQYILKYLEELE